MQEPLQLAIIGVLSHEPPDTGQGSWQIREQARLPHRLHRGPNLSNRRAAGLLQPDLCSCIQCSEGLGPGMIKKKDEDDFDQLYSGWFPACARLAFCPKH